MSCHLASGLLALKQIKGILMRQSLTSFASSSSAGHLILTLWLRISKRQKERPVSKRWTLPKGLSDCGLNYLVVIFFAQMVQNVCKSDGSCLHKLHYPHSAVISAYIRSASSHCGIVLNKAKSLLLVKFYRQHTQSIRTAIILYYELSTFQVRA